MLPVTAESWLDARVSLAWLRWFVGSSSVRPAFFIGGQAYSHLFLWSSPSVPRTARPAQQERSP